MGLTPFKLITYSSQNPFGQMAPTIGLMAIMVVAFALCVQGTLGGVTCENLDKDECAFSVSTWGMRCVLEKRVRRSGEEAYSCGTSEIDADKLKDWIETDECIAACGLDRKSLGISSDFLLESQFMKSLCSPQCYDSCPNIVDLYFNLAAGEGVFLPKLCEAQGANAGREMAEIRSSGLAVAVAVAVAGPESGVLPAAPVMAPC